jgi:DNA-binding response OmpR family regulator
MNRYEILLVDDDPGILSMVSDALEYEGYQVTSKSSGEAAVKALDTKDFDLVVTDLKMGKTDGIAVLKEAKKVSPETMVIMHTGWPIDALQLGADDYILKPCGLDQLSKVVASCLERLEGKCRGGHLSPIGQADSSPTRHAGHSMK